MDAFEEFFAEHYRRVRRALMLALGSTEVVEDAVQEAFVRACVRWKRVGAMERPEAWLYVTAVNIARDEHRRHFRRTAAHQAQSEATSAGNDGTSSIVARVDVTMALEALPTRQRLAVVL